MQLLVMFAWLVHHWRLFRRKMRLDSGQGLIEYALILIFVAVVLIALISILGPGLTNIYQNVVDTLNGE